MAFTNKGYALQKLHEATQSLVGTDNIHRSLAFSRQYLSVLGAGKASMSQSFRDWYETTMKALGAVPGLDSNGELDAAPTMTDEQALVLAKEISAALYAVGIGNHD